MFGFQTPPVAPPQAPTPSLTPVEWLALLGILGVLWTGLRFFLARHLRVQDDRDEKVAESVEKLNTTIQKLDSTMRDLREEMLERFVTKEDHRRELDEIRSGFGLGRRRTDTCPNLECPHEDRLGG